MSKLTDFFRFLMDAKNRGDKPVFKFLPMPRYQRPDYPILISDAIREGIEEAEKALREKRKFVPRDDDPAVVVEAIDLQWQDDPVFRGPCVSFKLLAYSNDEAFERPNRSYVKVTSSCTEEQIDAKIERHMQGYREEIILEHRERVREAEAKVERDRASENVKAYVTRKQSRTMIL